MEETNAKKGEGRSVAHVRQDENGEWLIHPLDVHLTETSRRAGEFAALFGSADWARAAGLWHDLGKYKPDFQSYIRNASGFEADAHLENTPGKVDHSTAGAVRALEVPPRIGQLLAYLIAGHHAGLGNWSGDLEERVRKTFNLVDAKKGSIPKSILAGELPKSAPPNDREQAHLWVRILFSSLVDADFLDTEAFMDAENEALRGSGKTIAQLTNLLNEWMEIRDNELRECGVWGSAVNVVRREVLQACRIGANHQPGFFSLSVPTGGGKTLSSVAFALAHAQKFQKQRLILAIPYTSIIEQTAQVLTDIFGQDSVVEHHSNTDPDRETPQSRLASENWDAPIIVTTNVQLFESLYASRTSRCRKLHNIVNSVIILDEAQMLPPEKLMPTLSVLKGLVSHFRCTVVICTATQPRLVGEIGSESAKFHGLEGVRPIIEDPEKLSSKLQRVQIAVHTADQVDWANLATELAQHRQVLTIVNRRQDCRELWTALKAVTTEEPVHLSALMCGEHRSLVVAQVKRTLLTGSTLRVVSTQLVEAGVDIDFPVVYRAMAGLDSIAQAAGRCNREGRLNEIGGLGRVVVFRPPKRSPPGLLRKGEDACDELLRTMPAEVARLSPKAFDVYFGGYYGRVNDFGKEKFEELLQRDVGLSQFQFRSASEWYQLINEQGTRSVVVWYESERFDSRAILEEVKRFGPTRKQMRRLQRCVVNIPQSAFSVLRDQGSIQEVVGPEGALDLYCQSVPGLYDPTFGLRLEGPELSGMEFVC
jgi:CRISPR-associated endonuclease/helicase Cas3